jgi:hypothetical protein
MVVLCGWSWGCHGVDVGSARAALQTVVFITLGAFSRDLRCAVMLSFKVSITARSRQASDTQICVVVCLSVGAALGIYRHARASARLDRVDDGGCFIESNRRYVHLLAIAKVAVVLECGRQWGGALRQRTPVTPRFTMTSLGRAVRRLKRKISWRLRWFSFVSMALCYFCYA